MLLWCKTCIKSLGVTQINKIKSCLCSHVSLCVIVSLFFSGGEYFLNFLLIFFIQMLYPTQPCRHVSSVITQRPALPSFEIFWVKWRDSTKFPGRAKKMKIIRILWVKIEPSNCHVGYLFLSYNLTSFYVRCCLQSHVEVSISCYIHDTF